MSVGKMIRCLTCGKPIKGSYSLDAGDVIYCGECKAGIEVVSIDPLKLREVDGKDRKNIPLMVE